MNQPLRKIAPIAMLCALSMLSTACHKRVGPTTLKIVDPVRHYYPLVQGEDLHMNYLIINTGRAPFILQDIQPASLSIELEKTPPHLIPRGDSLYLSFVYHTDQNIGYVEHKIRIYGNVAHTSDSSAVMGEVELSFDTHIVRPTLDKSDYEERYWEKKTAQEKFVEGGRGNQGYYTDEDIQSAQETGKYEFIPTNNREKQVERTLEILHLK